MIKVRVPATSANLGVGYDCMGLALDDYATVTFEVIAHGLEILGCEEAYCNEDNLFYQAFLEGLKYMNETVSLSPTNPIKKPHHFILFRYAETLLNYAEAMNELGGPDYTSDADELPMSARTALNMVRSAANMPNITDNGDDFTTRLRNERRIELAFEDHRFWDIRRWMIGDVVKDIYGVKITKKGSKYSYTPVKIQTRVWEEKMNLYPIAQSEIYKNGNLTQNDGWE